MSTLFVDTVEPEGATTVLTLGSATDTIKIPGGGAGADKVLTSDASGNATWVAAAGGKVLNVVSTTVTSATVSTSSTTFVDITGLTVTISPTAATSNILIFVNLQISGNTGASVMVPMRLLRDATPIFIGDQLGTNRGRGAFLNRAHSDQAMPNYSGTFYDEAVSTTSATVYKMQWCTETGGYYGNLNQAAAGSDILKYSTGSSTITVMEIGV